MIKTALFEEAKHEQSKITRQGKQGLFEEISSNYVSKFFFFLTVTSQSYEVIHIHC